MAQQNITSFVLLLHRARTYQLSLWKEEDYKRGFEWCDRIKLIVRQTPNRDVLVKFCVKYVEENPQIKLKINSEILQNPFHLFLQQLLDNPSLDVQSLQNIIHYYTNSSCEKFSSTENSPVAHFVNDIQKRIIDNAAINHLLSNLPNLSNLNRKSSKSFQGHLLPQDYLCRPEIVKKMGYARLLKQDISKMFMNLTAANLDSKKLRKYFLQFTEIIRTDLSSLEVMCLQLLIHDNDDVYLNKEILHFILKKALPNMVIKLDPFLVCEIASYHVEFLEYYLNNLLEKLPIFLGEISLEEHRNDWFRKLENSIKEVADIKLRILYLLAKNESMENFTKDYFHKKIGKELHLNFPFLEDYDPKDELEVM